MMMMCMMVCVFIRHYLNPHNIHERKPCNLCGPNPNPTLPQPKPKPKTNLVIKPKVMDVDVAGGDADGMFGMLSVSVLVAVITLLWLAWQAIKASVLQPRAARAAALAVHRRRCPRVYGCIACGQEVLPGQQIYVCTVCREDTTYCQRYGLLVVFWLFMILQSTLFQ